MSLPKCIVPESGKTCLTKESGSFQHSINKNGKILKATFRILPDNKTLIISFDSDNNRHLKQSEIKEILKHPEEILISARNGKSEGWINKKIGSPTPTIKTITFTRR